jgi:hypothetical protein
MFSKKSRNSVKGTNRFDTDKSKVRLKQKCKAQTFGLQFEICCQKLKFPHLRKDKNNKALTFQTVKTSTKV